MNFQETFHYLKKAGVKALPVPGTNKYIVSFQDGQSMYIREKTLFRLAKSSVKDPHMIVQALKNSQTPLM